jgi:hypothetical protein
VFAGAGSLRSTVDDLLTFLGTELGYEQTSLTSAFAVTRDVQHRCVPLLGRLAGVRFTIHLGWLDSKEGGVPLLWHDGATRGFQSFMGFNPKTRTGVVVLSNAGSGAGVDDIGKHLLNQRVALLSADKLRMPRRYTEIALDAAVLDGYTGRYKFPEAGATVTRRDGHLVLQGDGDQPDSFYPSGAREFFSKRQDLQLRFEFDSQGRVTGFVFVNAGHEQRIPRVD